VSRFSRTSFDQWYSEVLAIGRSWSVHPSDIDAISHSWFVGCWQRGWRPDDALIAALQDVGMMDERGRIY